MDTQRGREWTGVLAMAVFVTLAAAKVAPAQLFKTWVNFDQGNGAFPEAALVQGLDGDLYGTTSSGGANNAGTVFKMSPNGTLTTLYSFCVQAACADGETPTAALVQDTDGSFYGTTSVGGVYGGGTIFKISPAGALNTLYSFCAQANCTDGGQPYAGLILATDGNFYGTTGRGGAYSYGTVFKIAPAGALTTLHSFCGQEGCRDGAYPLGGLVQGADGNFYGTTSNGGLNRHGTVFKMTAAGTVTNHFSFDYADGSYPVASLVQAADGNLYGTTYYGGANGNGTVFEITPAGALTTLHSFDSFDGANPEGALVQATDGNFYGTTFQGGAENHGTIFGITPGGALKRVISFGGDYGDMPAAGLVQDTSGTFYGTTSLGGNGLNCGTTHNDYRCGTVFELGLALGTFVETLPASGKVGTPVKILGTFLAGATSVTFNGVSADFQVLSPSSIETQVPSGATTGAVQVVTPDGTLTSNVPFHVIQ